MFDGKHIRRVGAELGRQLPRRRIDTGRAGEAEHRFVPGWEGERRVDAEFAKRSSGLVCSFRYSARAKFSETGTPATELWTRPKVAKAEAIRRDPGQVDQPFRIVRGDGEPGQCKCQETNSAPSGIEVPGQRPQHGGYHERPKDRKRRQAGQIVVSDEELALGENRRERRGKPHENQSPAGSWVRSQFPALRQRQPQCSDETRNPEQANREGGVRMTLGQPRHCVHRDVPDRIRRGGETNARQRPTGTYFDWQLLVLLLGVAITGFFTQILHFMRLDTERVWAYCAHLVTVLTFFILLPYSKLAHVGFRSMAMVFAEHYAQRRPAAQSSNQDAATS